MKKRKYVTGHGNQNIIGTDIIIKIFRGDKEKREILQPVQDQLSNICDNRSGIVDCCE